MIFESINPLIHVFPPLPHLLYMFPPCHTQLTPVASPSLSLSLSLSAMPTPPALQI